MPISPRSGATLLPIPLVAPGFRGLNLQNKFGLLDPAWATDCQNLVFDDSGRLAARNGYEAVTETPVSGTPNIIQIFEYEDASGDTEILWETDDEKIYSGTTTGTDVSGTATITVAGPRQFVNFNGNCYAFREGEQPIVYSGTAFSDLPNTSGTAPQGNCGIAFAGRLWGSSADGQSLQYSALLDAELWDTSDGAGSWDFTSVWPSGADKITALAVFNNNLLVFGRECILFLNDTQGSVLGSDPDQMVVVDVIGSTGCINRDSVKEIEGSDLLFLSRMGVQSLGRLIQERSSPIANISANVRDELISSITDSQATQETIRTVYSPELSFYLVSFPTLGRSFYFDTSAKMEDGSLRTTEWSISPLALFRTELGTIYLGMEDLPGQLCRYSGYFDDQSQIWINYKSGWLDLGEDFAAYLKILKHITASVYSAGGIDLIFSWAWDFNDRTFNSTTSVPFIGYSEYGIDEYALCEYSAGRGLSNVRVNASGTGQYIKIGVRCPATAQGLALQKISVFAKLGRMAK